jgi:magnesium-transporting ATPase (P-type)
MKRIFAILIGLSIILPIVVFARVASNCDDYCRNLNEPEIQPPPNQVCICNPLTATSVEAVIDRIIDFVWWFAIAIAPLMVVIAAFYILTAGGDPKKVEIGKNIILYAVIGLFVVMFAKSIVAIIREILK